MNTEAVQAIDTVLVIDTLEDACRVVLESLRPEQAELIRALCLEHGLRPSNYILSYCRLAHERGETSSMIDDRVRYDRDTASAPVPAVATPGRCEYCGRTFVGTKHGQRFCPDRDDGQPSCGRLWSLEHQIQRERPRPWPKNDPLAPLPPISPHFQQRTHPLPATETALTVQGEIADLRSQMSELRTLLLGTLRPSEGGSAPLPNLPPEPLEPDRPLE